MLISSSLSLLGILNPYIKLEFLNYKCQFLENDSAVSKVHTTKCNT